jgi:hypothetical protein
MADTRRNNIKVAMGVMTIAACLLGGSSAAWAQNRQPARDWAAEAKLRALIAQLQAQTAAAAARRQQPRPLPFRPGISGPQAGVLGGHGITVESRPPSAADLAAGRYVGGTPSTVGGLNPRTAETLNRFAPGLVEQLMESQHRTRQVWVAPTCVRGQFCW